MRYILSSVAACSSRVGCIKDIERLPGLVLETPLLFLYTKGGSIPNLTFEVLQLVTKDQPPLHIPISTVAHCQEAVLSYRKGIADFIGLKEYLTLCSIHDPAVATPQGFNEKDRISIWPRSGRRQLDPDQYMDMIEAFQPDMYQALCDGGTNLTSGKKRVQKAIDRSITMFDKCLQRHQTSEVLKKSAFLGVVEGGYSIEGRKISAKHLANSPAFGYVIDGLHNNGPDVEQLAFEDVKPVVEETLKHLPNERFRILHGCWNPEMVLSMVELGIDAFDSSYAYAVSERGGALVFQNCISNIDIPTSTTDASNGVEPEDDARSSPEPLEKKQKLISDVNQDASLAEDKSVSSKSGDSAAKSQSSGSNTKYEISLADKKYAEDLTPLSRSCSCLTCQKHTRAYIHHLLQTRELLGPVLLTVHNLHHYLEFFKGIRGALKSNSLDRLRKCVSAGVDTSVNH